LRMKTRAQAGAVSIRFFPTIGYECVLQGRQKQDKSA
jgi:hypothetical protein